MAEKPDKNQDICGDSGRPGILRVTTSPVSLQILLRGQLEYMQHRGYRLLAVSSAGPEVSSIVSSGIPHHTVDMTRSISPFRDLISLLHLIRVVRSFRPDIIHSHTPKAGLLAMLAGWICRVPVRIHTVAGLPLMEAQGVTKRILIHTERLTYFFSTTVWVNSFGLADYIHDHISRKIGRAQVLGSGSSNGIDLTHFNPGLMPGARQEIRRRLGLGPDAKVFVFVGRLVRDKGVGELLAAFDALGARVPDCALILVGTEEPERDPLSTAERARIAQGAGIHAVGYQQDVRPWILAADVLVLPSYREGLPNVLLQAGALERAAVATDINGCNEIVEDGVTGILIKPRDAEGLTGAMITLASDEQMREKMGKAARVRIAAKYDQQQLWAEIERNYRRMLDIRR